MNKREKLARCSIILDDVIDSDFIFNKTSLFQGALYEQLNSEYVDRLHEQGLKPYSQNLQKKDGKVAWTINTLNNEAYDNIIVPIMNEEFNHIRISHNDIDIKILDKSVSETYVDSLFEHFYEEDSSRYFDVKFETPTAFKRGGRYCFYPEIHNIYQSLMNKFDAVSPNRGMFSFETLEQMVENSQITGYNLRSVRFGLEGISIPSFTGRIQLKVNGSQTMVNFARLLFEFGNFSGVGIKTALGMGSVHVRERGRNGK